MIAKDTKKQEVIYFNIFKKNIKKKLKSIRLEVQAIIELNETLTEKSFT